MKQQLGPGNEIQVPINDDGGKQTKMTGKETQVSTETNTKDVSINRKTRGQSEKIEER